MLTATSSGLMYLVGKRYALKETATLPGAIFRCAGWSILVCWTVILVRGGVLPGFIPLPSWGALTFWALETNTSLSFIAKHETGVSIQFIPHILASPAVPLAAYLVAYILHRDEN